MSRGAFRSWLGGMEVDIVGLEVIRENLRGTVSGAIWSG